jgi:hypothetical protein
LTLLGWIAENKNWIFEGIGVAALSVLFFVIKRIFKDDKASVSQSQQSGDNSINIQVGGNLDIDKSSTIRSNKK